MKTRNVTRIFGLALIFVALAIGGPIVYYRTHANSVVSAAPHSPVQSVTLPQAPALVTGKPVSLSIPSLNMNLPVTDGFYDKSTGKWTLTLDKAQFATPSAPPNNETGNTLIYGHYRREVFARLHLIKPGSQALVVTDNGYRFSYTYQSNETFDPADTSIFAYTGAPRLTIQTCSGVFYQHRQMFYFAYNGYEKI